MEARGQLHSVAVDTAGVERLGGVEDLVRQGGQLLYYLALLLRGEQGCVHGGGVRHGVAVRGQVADDGADARVGVLHVVDGVLAVLAHGEAEVEVHLRVGAGVEEPARRIDGYLVEQIAERDGLAGALGHAHHLAVAHELH